MIALVAASLVGLGTGTLLIAALRREPRANVPEDVGYRPAGVAASRSGFEATRSLVRRFGANRRKRRFESELPGALDLVAGSLEAGSSLAQAIEMVAQEGSPPLSEELARAVAENKLGVPIADALDAAAARAGSRDFHWVVRAIRAQQEFGASLAHVLRTSAELIRHRGELHREVRALTAEGRISAWVLLALPFAVAGFFMLTNPAYLGTLFAHPLGWTLLAGSAVLMVAGAFWMSRIVKVEV